eukprot:tig00020902_g15050.t1
MRQIPSVFSLPLGADRKTLQHYLDFDPEMARREDAAAHSTLVQLLRKLEKVAFSVLFYLTDRTGRSPGFWTRIFIPYAFLFYDFTQLMTLSMPPRFPDSAGAWLSYPGTAESIFASVQSSWFASIFRSAAIFWSAAVFIIFTYCLTGYVFYMSVTQSLRVFPLRLLRMIASFLVDASFIPATQILAQPLACYVADHAPGPAGVVRDSVLSSIRNCPAFHGQGGSLAPGYLAVSIALLLTFVPYALVFRLIFYDSCPVSFARAARPHGRFSFLYAIVQSTMIFVNLFVGASVRSSQAVNFALLVLVCIFIQVTVPFYSTFENCLRAGLFLAAAAFPMTSRLIDLAPEGDEAALFHYASLALALIVPFFVSGATFTFVRIWLVAGARPRPAAAAAAARYAAAPQPRSLPGLGLAGLQSLSPAPSTAAPSPRARPTIQVRPAPRPPVVRIPEGAAATDTEGEEGEGEEDGEGASVAADAGATGAGPAGRTSPPPPLNAIANRDSIVVQPHLGPPPPNPLLSAPPPARLSSPAWPPARPPPGAGRPAGRPPGRTRPV